VTAQGYGAFAARVLADGWLPDPWCAGQPRLHPHALVLARGRARSLTRAAEGVAAATDALCRLVTRQPHWVDWLGLTQVQRALWWVAAPRWHGLARADVFETADGGVQVCEMNSDTPSGFAEAAVLGRLTVGGGTPANADLIERWRQLVAACAPVGTDPRRALTVGIVWPTEFTEDLPMIQLWQAACEHAGWRVAVGSPFNLTLAADGRAALLGTPCDVIVRHYKTDWWAERQPVWRDEPPPVDDAPLFGPLRVLVQAQMAGRTSVVNPLGAVLSQNKRATALLWHLRDRLPLAARAAIDRWVPQTWRMEDMDPVQLRDQQTGWVLKTDYGCEGDEVVVGAEVEAAVWQRTLDLAVPGRWIAQRRFEPARDPDGCQVNFGVFLVAGRCAGWLVRTSLLATDGTARIGAACIQPAAGSGPSTAPQHTAHVFPSRAPSARVAPSETRTAPPAVAGPYGRAA